MPKILDLMIERNAWWSGDFKVAFKEREVYRQVKKYLGMKQIVSFTGLRRVGKTTLLLKIIEDSIASGMDPKDILFFSFDEARDVELRDVIKEYENFCERSLKDGGHLLVLDEVQKLADWENQVKTVYDIHSATTKILLSGSESLSIRKKSKESLAGRIFEFKVNPLSFAEFLDFKGRHFDNIRLHEGELRRLLNEFIRIQGFPELIGIDDPVAIRKYIVEGIAERILYKDIPEAFEVENIGALKAMLNMLMQDPGQIIEYIRLASDLGISRQTASDYLSYLEDAFLIRRLYNYSKKSRRQEKKLKKYYPTVLSPELTYKTDDLYRSKVFEWLAVSQLDAKFFWRDAYKHEVDIVTEGGFPIEVKYGGIELENVFFFLNKFKQREGYVISSQVDKEVQRDEKTIKIMNILKVLLGKESIMTGASP